MNDILDQSHKVETSAKVLKTKPFALNSLCIQDAAGAVHCSADLIRRRYAAQGAAALLFDADI